LESAPLENTESHNLDESKEETSSTSDEQKEKRRIFFLTKSLAEVYAKQGQISMALEIYKRMLKINPSDQDIEKRINELESHLSAKRGIKVKEHDASV
jgi:pentatricopeptide repeat protein